MLVPISFPPGTACSPAGSEINQLGEKKGGWRWLVAGVLVSMVKDGLGESQHRDVDILTADDVEVDKEVASDLVLSSVWVSVVTDVKVTSNVSVLLVVSVWTQVVLIQIGPGDTTCVTVVVVPAIVVPINVELESEAEKVLGLMVTAVELRPALDEARVPVGRWVDVEFQEIGAEFSVDAADAGVLLSVRVSVIEEDRPAVLEAVGLTLAVELTREIDVLVVPLGEEFSVSPLALVAPRKEVEFDQGNGAEVVNDVVDTWPPVPVLENSEAEVALDMGNGGACVMFDVADETGLPTSVPVIPGTMVEFDTGSGMPVSDVAEEWLFLPVS